MIVSSFPVDCRYRFINSEIRIGHETIYNVPNEKSERKGKNRGVFNMRSMIDDAVKVKPTVADANNMDDFSVPKIMVIGAGGAGLDQCGPGSQPTNG